MARQTFSKSVNFRRALRIEMLESRKLLAADLTEASSLLAEDTDGDGYVAPSDALVIINELNKGGARRLPQGDDRLPEAHRICRLDSDEDGHLAPSDALRIINRLNAGGSKKIGVEDLNGGHGELVSDAQKANLRKLFEDLNAIRSTSNVTNQQIVQLVRDLGQVLDGAVPPSAESVAQLTGDLTSSLADGSISLVEIATLKNDLSAVLVSANVPQEEIDALQTDIAAIVSSSGITAAQITTILQDVQAIITEAKNQNPSDDAVPHPPRQGDHDLPRPPEPAKLVLGRTLMELTHIGERNAIPAELLTKLKTDIQTALVDATRPELATVLTLIKDWRAARQDRVITSAEKETLHTDLVNLLASANVSTAAANLVIADIEAIFALFGSQA